MQRGLLAQLSNRESFSPENRGGEGSRLAILLVGAVDRRTTDFLFPPLYFSPPLRDFTTRKSKRKGEKNEERSCSLFRRRSSRRCIHRLGRHQLGHTHRHRNRRKLDQPDRRIGRRN